MLLQKIKKSNFITRLKSWEYWPFEVLYLPIFFYWFWLSLKARSLFFFSASNPGIENGGMLGESKIKILDKIKDCLKPITLFLAADEDAGQVLKKLKQNRLSFPVIAKPDIGERGWMVEKITSKEELARYIGKIKVNYLIQEFIDLPLEAGVFYYRYPHQSKGKVSSIVIKDLLKVCGDGKSSIKQLVIANERAKLQLNELEKGNKNLDQILKNGEIMTLVEIGNHCKGTTFLNGNYLINQNLIDAFDTISKGIEGFYYGRFDLRCGSEEDLCNGNIKIMELNGAGSEPAHIYHPGFSLFSAYKVLFEHWKALFNISKANNKLGVRYLSFQEGIEEYRKVREYNKIKANTH